MQTDPRSFVMNWKISALNHLLNRHNIKLDKRRTNQILDLLGAIDRLSSTTPDHLEILRLFEKALSNRQHFKIGRRALSTVDLFYASMIVGLKINNETHHHYISLDEINLRLRKPSYYGENQKLSKALEHAFLKGLNWRVHESLQELTNAYITLLKPLHQTYLAQFSTSFLITASADAGEHHLLHKVLCRLNPHFREKSNAVMQGIQALPMRHCFIESHAVRESMKYDIFNFLTDDTPYFRLCEETLNIIRYTISDYFRAGDRHMQNNACKQLGFYFSAEKIDRLFTHHICARVNAIKSELNPTNHRPYDTLIKQLTNNQLDTAWLAPILDGIEKMNGQHALTTRIFSDIFENYLNSNAILKCYLNILREGWLSVSNERKILSDKIADLIYHHHHEQNLVQDIEKIMRTYFTKIIPDLQELTLMHNPGQSELGLSLACDLSTIFLINLVKEQAVSVGIPNETLKEYSHSLVNYVKQHANERISILYALIKINPIIKDISHSLYLNIISSPDELRFKAKLTIILHLCFKDYDLTSIPRELPTIYELIINSIKNDMAALRQIQAFFENYTPKNNNGPSTLNNLPGIKPHVRSVIDTFILSGQLNLTKATQNELANFYNDYKIPAIDTKPIANALPPCHLFFSKNSAAISREPYQLKKTVVVGV